jgi:CRP-like cAMP-binding protein
VQSFLSSVELLADLSDLEKLLLASVVVDRELPAGAALDEFLCEGSLLIVRAGTVHCRETLPDGRVSETRAAVAGELFGGLPIDPLGLTRCAATAATDAALLAITADGFAYLLQAHAELGFKLLSCWTLALRDRGFAIPPRE